jgi:hypothetical protein
MPNGMAAMIDPYRGEVFFHLILDERRREAERVRSVLVYRQPGAGSLLLAALGRLLMRVGNRLQERAIPATPARIVDPCRGCAN